MSRPLPPADFYRPNAYAADESVGYLLRRLLGSMKQETDKRLEPHGLTNAQWEPLYRLRKGMASTVAELARELQTDPGATTRLLDRLEAKGLCKRIRSTEDRRVVYVKDAAGSYGPREIQIGLQGELFTEVTGGLKSGEQVVTFGSFFIDADFKLKGL